jgi:iron(II)-dependent oxidoreductase
MNASTDVADTVTTGELANWVRQAAQRLADLVIDLDDARMWPPRLAVVNPLLWEIGHVTWFQEAFVLRRALSEPPIVERADAIWDSAAIPHDTRWSLDLPGREETLRYIEDVTDRIVDRLHGPWSSGQLHYVTRYTVHHHDMHTEALTYTRQTLGYPMPVLPDVDTVPAPDAGPLPGDVEVPGGTFALGADRDGGFVHDNEKWVHPVRVEPFSRHVGR